MSRSRTLRFVAPGFVLSALFSLTVMADPSGCSRAMDREAYDEALEKCLLLAEQGDPKAMHSLGFIYVTVNKDYLEAYAWYHRAASAGDANARNLLPVVRDQSNRQYRTEIVLLRSEIRRLQLYFIDLEEEFAKAEHQLREVRLSSQEAVTEINQQSQE